MDRRPSANSTNSVLSDTLNSARRLLEASICLYPFHHGIRSLKDVGAVIYRTQAVGTGRG
jgi:hypothetical protein